MQNFREKYMQEYIDKIESKKHLLNDWEREFLTNIKNRLKNKLQITNHQFNKLKEIAEKI